MCVFLSTEQQHLEVSLISLLSVNYATNFHHHHIYSDIDKSALFWNLKKRYERNKIYVSVLLHASTDTRSHAQADSVASLIIMIGLINRVPLFMCVLLLLRI